MGYIIDRWAMEIQRYMNDGIPKEHIEIMYATLERLSNRLEELNRATRRRAVEKR